MKILIVEDEKELANSIVNYLVKFEEFTCDMALNYNKAMQLMESFDYDCLIVDIGLPDGSGLDVIREAKSMDLNMGIIIISANNTLDDKIEGLNVGADDYLIKPFHLSELNARVHSILRRIRFEGKSVIKIDEMLVDTLKRQVTVKDENVDLTKSEYDLLLYFLSNRNKVLTKVSIAEHLCGEYIDIYSSLDFVYTHIKNLRKKLLDKGCPDYIKTVYGVGYKFITE
ncbi:MAG: response regulator transcription factor [Bacteroidetes bacterium]|nr:response regulator transcription factor [Bacteroidota bacterium]